MLFLVSGEGQSDIGICTDGNIACGVPEFRMGPMTIVIDRVILRYQQYSPLEAGVVRCISKGHLIARAQQLKAARKSLGLPGKKRAKETRYFFNNARALARCAIEVGDLQNDDVVAILFRDSDGTASAGRGLWQSKWQSMLDGFEEEGFSKGVPMIPKPKSEAWLLCALKDSAYQNCEQLEERSGNDDSPNSLKRELSQIMNRSDTTEELRHQLTDGRIDIHRINMSSFAAFRQRLEAVV